MTQSQDHPPLVAIRSVSKSYGEFVALKQVSLDVWSGEVLCVIGASGSGKTTLLRCINQLTPIDGGGIWLDGELLGLRLHDGRLHRLSERQAASEDRHGISALQSVSAQDGLGEYHRRSDAGAASRI